MAEEIPRWTLADRLRKAREWRGLDQKELADYLDLAQPTVSAYEKGTRRPKSAFVRVWAQRCGVPFEWLWQDDEPGAIVLEEPQERDSDRNVSRVQVNLTHRVVELPKRPTLRVVPPLAA